MESIGEILMLDCMSFMALLKIFCRLSVQDFKSLTASIRAWSMRLPTLVMAGKQNSTAALSFKRYGSRYLK